MLEGPEIEFSSKEWGKAVLGLKALTDQEMRDVSGRVVEIEVLERTAGKARCAC